MRDPDSHHYIDGMALRRFVLGTSSEEEAKQIEAALLNHPEALERLEAEEMQVADEYVLGVLPGEEQQHFEKRMALSPECRDSVELSRALFSRYRRESRVPRWWLGVAASLVLIAVSLMVWQARKPSTPPVVSSSQSATPAAVPAQVVFWRLRGGQTRGANDAVNEFTHPGPDKIIEIRLPVRSSKNVPIVIEAVDSTVVWRGQTILKSGELAVQIPASELPRADLIIFPTGYPAFSLTIH